MALQTSGTISLLDLQNEYGGSNHIGMDEYYRNGSFVPNALTSSSTGPGSYTAYQYNLYNYFWSVFVFGSINWAGSSIASNLINIAASTTSFSTGGYDYERGPFVQTVTSGSGKFTSTVSYYQVRRRQSSVTTTTSTPVNQNVPTSGQIAMSNFYGGRKT